MLDGIEKVGNKVPHPVIMFLYLIAVHRRAVGDPGRARHQRHRGRSPSRSRRRCSRTSASSSAVRSSPYDVVTDQIVEIPEYTIQEQTFEVRSLLSVEGCGSCSPRSSTTSPAFGVVAVTFVAMAGVGVAEKAGMMGALIRKIVKVAPAGRAGVHPHLRRCAVERRLRRRLPHPDPARRRRRSSASGATRWPGMAAAFAGVGASSASTS